MDQENPSPTPPQSPQLVMFDAIMPATMAVRAEQIGVKKAASDPLTVLVLGVLGGAFISFGAIFATTVSAEGAALPYGVLRLLSGLAFSIGLILVVLYSLFYYRALGLVTISSLIVSGGLTYASLVILGAQIGFTLTLAGIAGFIVAVGITADSFVVLFERIKDEVHEGRTMRVAVPRAWIQSVMHL